MKLKKYEGLSSYLIDEDGNVHSDAGIIPMISERRLAGTKYVTESFYKLKTDDLHGGFNIIRRFSREDIVKMYNSPKATRYDVTVVKGTEPSGTVISGIEEAGEISEEIFKQLKTKDSKLISATQVETTIEKKLKATAKAVKSTLDRMEKTVGFKITSRIRTPKEQKKLLKKGRKKPMKSVHNPSMEARLSFAHCDPAQSPLVDHMTEEVVLLFLKEGEGLRIPFKKLKEIVQAEYGTESSFYLVNGVIFESARKAAKDCGISVNTVLKRCKANKDGYFYIEK